MTEVSEAEVYSMRGGGASLLDWFKPSAVGLCLIALLAIFQCAPSGLPTGMNLRHLSNLDEDESTDAVFRKNAEYEKGLGVPPTVLFLKVRGQDEVTKIQWVNIAGSAVLASLLLPLGNFLATRGAILFLLGYVSVSFFVGIVLQAVVAGAAFPVIRVCTAMGVMFAVRLILHRRRDRLLRGFPVLIATA